LIGPSHKKWNYWGLPIIEGSILKHLWPTYICEMRITFAKEYGIKVRCYWNPLGNMSKTWELLALNTPPPQTKKKKNLAWKVNSGLSTIHTNHNLKPHPHPSPTRKKGKAAHSLHDTTSHWLHVNPIPKIGCTIFGLDNCSVGSVSTLTKTNKFFVFFQKMNSFFNFLISCFSIIYYDIVIQVVKLLRVQAMIIMMIVNISTSYFHKYSIH